MSILNVNTIQPVGSGQTITVSATNISAPSTVVTASSFVGNYYLTLSTPIDDAASNNGRVIQASDISNGDVISGTIMYIST